MYADDLKLYTNVELQRPNTLKADLEELTKWANKWQLGINIDKCSVLHIGKQTSDDKYFIGINEIPSVEKVCDLGVSYNGKINFGEHIDRTVSKAYQRIYLIFKGFLSMNIDLLKRAYTVYVRPLLEYCTQVWSPHLIGDIVKIENVQRYFTRRLLQKGQAINYDDRMKLLSLESLELRRLKFDLMMYFRIIRGFCCIEKLNFFVFLPALHKTRSHDFQLQKQIYSNNALNNTFSNRAIDCWNGLPSKTVNAANFAVFKKLLNKIELTFFSPYLPGRISAP
jgi:hypothetical protein